MYKHIISFGESMRFPLAATSSTWQSALFLLSANLAEVIEIIHDFPNTPDQCIECACLVQIDQDHTNRDCKDHPHNTAHPVTDEHE